MTTTRQISLSVSRAAALFAGLVALMALAGCASKAAPTTRPADDSPSATQPADTQPDQVAQSQPSQTQPAAPPALSQNPEPVFGPVIQGPQAYADTIQAGADALRDFGFVIDRQDYRYGLVTTRPLNAPTAVEVWKPTNTSFDQVMEATLNNQRRVARVRLHPVTRPLDVGTYYQISVQVQVQKLQQPLRRLNGSTQGNGMISRLSEVPAEWQERGITRAYWLADGYDPLLSQRILEQIVQRLERDRPDPALRGRSYDQPGGPTPVYRPAPR